MALILSPLCFLYQYELGHSLTRLNICHISKKWPFVEEGGWGYVGPLMRVPMSRVDFRNNLCRAVNEMAMALALGGYRQILLVYLFIKRGVALPYMENRANVNQICPFNIL